MESTICYETVDLCSNRRWNVSIYTTLTVVWLANIRLAIAYLFAPDPKTEFADPRLVSWDQHDGHHDNGIFKRQVTKRKLNGVCTRGVPFWDVRVRRVQLKFIVHANIVALLAEGTEGIASSFGGWVLRPLL